MLHLVGGGLEVVLVCSLHLHGRGMRLDSCAAVEAHMVVIDDRVVLNHGAVFIHVVHMHATEVRDCSVVREGSAPPLAAEEANAAVTEAVVDAAIEADVGTPVACMPTVETACRIPSSPGSKELQLLADAPRLRAPSNSRHRRKPNSRASR